MCNFSCWYISILFNKSTLQCNVWLQNTPSLVNGLTHMQHGGTWWCFKIRCVLELLKILLLLHSCAEPGCGVASLADGTAVLLMHCPLSVSNFFSGCRWWLAHSLRRTLGDLYLPPTNVGRRDTQFHVHPRDGTHADESPCLWNTWKIVYTWAGIQTQVRQLWGCYPTGNMRG